MKRIRLLIVILLLPAAIQAQSLSPQASSSCGGFYSNSAGSLSLTIGQPSPNTFISDSLALTQGFQQPETDIRILLSGSTWCNGDSITLPFITPGYYGSSNQFEAQLSDATGSFTAPTVLGTVTGTSGNVINTQLPFTLPAGTNYRIRIKSSVPALNSNQLINTINFCWVRFDLSAFIEGFYLGSNSMSPVLYNQGLSSDPTATDSLSIALHHSTAPYSVVESLNTILYSDGTASCLFPSGIYGNTYYVVLKHRNSIETWSKLPLLFDAQVKSYDFTQ